jgi:hypothetical protein
MIVIEKQSEQQIFDEIIAANFAPVIEKPVPVIVVEVGIQLASLWVLTTMAINIWRFCTGC